MIIVKQSHNILNLFIFFNGDKVIKYLKKVIMAAFLLYAFNMVAINFNIVLPINIWTIAFTSLFDMSGLGVLLLIKTIGA